MTRMVILVAGPPGAGKTTLARALADRHGLTLYDRDDSRWPGEREFRAALDALATDPTARAVVIRSCATARAWHTTTAQIGATRTELVDTAPDLCRDRIAHDTDRNYDGRTWNSKSKRLAGVRTWWAEHAADPWMPLPRLPAPSRRW